MAGGYYKSVWYGREYTHKSRVARGNATLRINTFWETLEIISDVWEKSAAVDSAEPNSKDILPRLCPHFVGARFLLTQDFFKREIFVNARILLAREFLSMREFC
jgi:hypothetical protein